MVRRPASSLPKSFRGEEVDLEFDEEREDRYDRLLAYVHKDEEMFNETLLEEGYAQVYIVDPNDEYEDRFEEAQAEAQAAERGIWALAESELALLTDRGNGVGGVVAHARPPHHLLRLLLPRARRPVLAHRQTRALRPRLHQRSGRARRLAPALRPLRRQGGQTARPAYVTFQ